MKKIRDNANRWRDMPCSCIGKLSLVKMTVLSKAIQIQCNPYQDTNSVFHRIRTNNFAICMDAQKTQIAKAILRKKKGKNRNRRKETELTDSTFLTSEYTTKPQSSGQYDTDTKKEIQTKRTR